MDVVHDRASIIVEEDRISNLADDIIHHILSFLDMKYAIQTSTLSKKWKHIWTSMPILNFNSQMFRTLCHFAKFVKHVLAHRNHRIEVSAVELSIREATAKFVGQSIVKYAYSHNVRQLTVKWLSRTNLEFPECLFSSHTLKHLTLANNGQRLNGGCISESVWDFPALETLNLSNIKFDENGNENLDIFSKCVNLKDLTLHRCSMSGLNSFNVCAPQLSNLTITDPYGFPTVINLVAPQLENLTASVTANNDGHIGSLFLRLSTKSLASLKKVNLFVSRHSSLLRMHAPRLLPDLFQKLSTAKILILDIGIVEALYSCMDQLSHEPCPFNKLKSLEINNAQLKRKKLKVRNYLLESSPGATFNINLPEVLFKRSREEVDNNTLAIKVAKLEEEEQKKDEVIAQQKAMLEAMNLQLEKLMSRMINRKMAELQVQVEGGDPDYKLIHSMGRAIKTIMELTPKSLRVAMETQLSCRYEEVKRLFLTRVDASQWARIETELGIIGHSERTNSNVRVAALSPLPSPSSANMATSSTQAFLGD